MSIILSGFPVRSVSRVILICLAALPFLFTVPSAAAFDLLFGTNEQAAFSHFSARGLCRLVGEHSPDLTCTLVDSRDDIDILTNLVGGSLDLALVDSQLLHDALTGHGPFAFLDISYEGLRSITPLFNLPVTLIVRRDAGITAVADLRGKRINTGPPGSARERLFAKVMQAYGWSDNDFSLVAALSPTLSQDILAFSEGSVQVLLHRGVHPDPTVERLLKGGGAQLIGLTGREIESMTAANPGLSAQRLPASAYPFLSGPIVTIGTTVTLVTTADLDNDTVRLLMAALTAGTPKVRAMHPALADFSLEPGTPQSGGPRPHEAVSGQLTKEDK